MIEWCRAGYWQLMCIAQSSCCAAEKVTLYMSTCDCGYVETTDQLQLLDLPAGLVLALERITCLPVVCPGSQKLSGTLASQITC
jgi:hypothetical protein